MKLLIIALVSTILTAWSTVSEGGTRRALIVGVENYPQAQYALPGVRDDLGLIKEILVKQGLFSDSEILLLQDEQAKKANIIGKFQEWLIDGTKEGDTALFYFSGHGVQIWDENGDEIQDGRDEALMCWDSKPKKNKTARIFRGLRGFAFELKHMENFLLDDEIHDLLEKLKGRTVIFVSDSCHSGSVRKAINPSFVKYKTIDEPVTLKSPSIPRRPSLTAKSGVHEPTNLGKDLDVKKVRLVSYTASEDSQPAAIVHFTRQPAGRHSVFTWYLYNGLRGKADLDGNGKVTYGELARFLQEETKKDQQPQIPQYYFSPGTLESQTFIEAKALADGSVDRPHHLGCALKLISHISTTEKNTIRDKLSKIFPVLIWTDDAKKALTMIEVEKKADIYSMRLSDASGSYWESQTGRELGQVVEDVGKNLRAYYIQSYFAALRNPRPSMRFKLGYTQHGPNARAEAEVCEGDGLVFRVRSENSGYLYVVNVDTQGVIHPLYPGPNGQSPRLGAGVPVTIGTDQRFVVSAPFGKELVFACLTDKPLKTLSSFWAKDDIGDTASEGMEDQQRFLDALWAELTESGRPKGQWTTRTLFLESFRNTTGES